MQQEVQRTVDRFKDVLQEQEKELEQKTGIEANMKEEDIKSYLEEVLQEVGKTKKPT
jgi:short-subunit dehydrogenase